MDCIENERSFTSKKFFQHGCSINHNFFYFAIQLHNIAVIYRNVYIQLYVTLEYIKSFSVYLQYKPQLFFIFSFNYSALTWFIEMYISYNCMWPWTILISFQHSSHINHKFFYFYFVIQLHNIFLMYRNVYIL